MAAPPARARLFHSDEYATICGRLPANGDRDALLYALLRACGVTARLLDVAPPPRAQRSHLERFHTAAYLDAVQAADAGESSAAACLKRPRAPAAACDYGLDDDCAPFEGLWEYCLAVAGASLGAAHALARRECAVAINMGGGRHHAMKAKAAGFCYVNDAVLAILHLCRAFPRVLYVDIDVHHSDGVERSFYQSDAVLHVSFHKLARGFFPGTGAPGDAGAGAGAGATVNVPVADGASDETFFATVDAVLSSVARRAAPPDAVVLCAGVDTLSGDPLGAFNLSSRGIARCVERVAALGKPMLVLGGGGYRAPDAARAMAHVVAAAAGGRIDDTSVPEHEHFPRYGPDFAMHTTAAATRADESPAGAAAAAGTAAARTLDALPTDSRWALPKPPQERAVSSGEWAGASAASKEASASAIADSKEASAPTGQAASPKADSKPASPKPGAPSAVVFLDIDGVLHALGPDFLPRDSDREALLARADRIIALDSAEDDGATACPIVDGEFNAACLARLKRVVDAVPGTVLVLSSTWRQTPCMLRAANAALVAAGLPAVSAVTGSGESRAAEIRAWLDEHADEATPYCAIDDADLSALEGRWIAVDGAVGLTDGNAEAAIAALSP